MRKIFIVGHRGAPSLAPENTLPSFEKAIELGVDFIELDVRQTKDGILVIIHDEKVDRTTDGTGEVSQLSLKQIKKLDAGSWFSPQFKGTTVPTLEEVLKNFGKKICYIIELKVKGIEEKVMKLVEEYDLIENAIILSSHWESLKKVKLLDSNITTIADLPIPTPSNLQKAISYYANMVSIHRALLKKEFVRLCHRRGIMVNAWPINTKEELEFSLNCEVDFITTDYPQLMIKYLNYD